MTKFQKVGLFLLIIGTLVYIKFAFFHTEETVQPPAEETTVTPEPAKVEELSDNKPKSTVNVYFIGRNENKEEVYKIVKRAYSPQTDGTKLRASITNLLKGPTKEEKAKGIYTEIPRGTKLLSIEETPEKVVINLSSTFEQDGGTDGLYKRIYQLIKTSNKNTALEVYLYINGKQADVIGGEGIMINQPLNEKSLQD